MVYQEYKNFLDGLRPKEEQERLKDIKEKRKLLKEMEK